MTRPKLSDVSGWHDVTIDVHEPYVKVEEGTLTTRDGYVHPGGAFSVRNLTTGKRTLFYGETAWYNAERLAEDIYWEARRKR